MAKVENDHDYITQLKIQILKDKKTNLQQLWKKRNPAGWKLISTSTAILDNKNQFSNLNLIWEKELGINLVDTLHLFSVSFTI